jgi:hypothetical protein
MAAELDDYFGYTKLEVTHNQIISVLPHPSVRSRSMVLKEFPAGSGHVLLILRSEDEVNALRDLATHGDRRVCRNQEGAKYIDAIASYFANAEGKDHE